MGRAREYTSIILHNFLQESCVAIETSEWLACMNYNLLSQVCNSGGGCIHCEVHRLQGSQFQHSLLL